MPFPESILSPDMEQLSVLAQVYDEPYLIKQKQRVRHGINWKSLVLVLVLSMSLYQT